MFTLLSYRFFYVTLIKQSHQHAYFYGVSQKTREGHFKIPTKMVHVTRLYLGRGILNRCNGRGLFFVILAFLRVAQFDFLHWRESLGGAIDV